VYFPAKQAYTGEDTVEFYLHGGVRIMQGALDTLLANGAVMAKNGEFTKRAFLSGRLSLADAEGVIDMINAESAAGLRAAYRLMEGDVAKRINAILDKLEELIATIEATLDYPDEMEDEVLPNLENNIKDILVKVKDLIASAKNGKIAKYGLTVALAGNPNAGKSSLMNALLKENRAIVTPVAGTTRDTVEDSFEYDGVKITLVDTAGLRESKDIVESEGIERAKRAIESADVVLHVIDSTADDKDDIDFGDKLVFDVYNKCDISNERNVAKDNKSFVVSAKT
ncbi:MAG: tRNA uridine-5-carboxymethylaminomethyl(34) synthesis GTPase MnmE, partial [Bacteroidales bacterium]|nr:tRNA uridine-5-carboxymethylaminomethyl(34) synthesis GTPase MnmE [Bacteroidales bacterium]